MGSTAGTDPGKMGNVFWLIDPGKCEPLGGLLWEKVLDFDSLKWHFWVFWVTWTGCRPISVNRWNRSGSAPVNNCFGDSTVLGFRKKIDFQTLCFQIDNWTQKKLVLLFYPRWNSWIFWNFTGDMRNTVDND